MSDVTKTVSEQSFSRLVSELLKSKSALEAFFNDESVNIDLDTDEGVARAKEQHPEEYEEYAEIKQALIELQA